MTGDEKVLSKVPRLRFSEFSGSWGKHTVGSLTSLITYGLTVRPSFVECGVPLISAREIRTGVVELAAAPMIDRKDFDTLSSKAKPKKGDIFLSKTGSIGFVAEFTSEVDAAISQNIALLRFSSVNTDFILQYLNTRIFQTAALSKVNKSTIMDLQLRDIAKLNIWMPSSEGEISLIATFLSTVDKKISLLKQKHEQLVQYKKGIMQQLFSQQLRFKDDNGQDFPDWEVKHLSELADKVTKKNADDAVKSVLTNSAKHGIVNQLDYFDKDIANENNLTNYGVVEKDDFVYNPRISVHAPVGPIKRNHIGKGVMSPLYTVFRFKEPDLFDFLEIFFRTTLWHRYMNSIANFGARHDRMNITSGDFFALPIKVPCEEERIKLVDFVKSVDQKINLAQQQIEQTQTYKQGLLQQMFV